MEHESVAKQSEEAEPSRGDQEVGHEHNQRGKKTLARIESAYGRGVGELARGIRLFFHLNQLQQMREPAVVDVLDAIAEKYDPKKTIRVHRRLRVEIRNPTDDTPSEEPQEEETEKETAE